MRTQRPNQQHAARGKEREQEKMFVRDLMTTNVTSISPDATVREAAKQLSELDVGSLPVCEDGRLVGIVTDRDLVVRIIALDQSGDAKVSEAMSDEVVSAYADDDANTLLERMRDEELRRIPVIDRDEKLVGIVALADVARSDASARTKAQALEGVS